MANAFSIVHNFDNQKLYTPDFNFITAALSSKQQKLDLNRSKLQNLYDQYSILNVHNAVDKEYLEGRLEQVRDITNQYASMDMSDANFATSLMNNVGQVLDDKVKNAVLSTKILQAEDASWAKAKKEKPDTYSMANHEYALVNSDRGRYENAQEAGEIYRGGAGFIEYRDISKKLMDNIPALQKALEAEWVTTGPQQGYFRSIDTYKSIDPGKMKQALESLFDERDKKQMNINAWAKYKDLPETTLKQTYESYFEPKNDQAKQDLKALEVLKSQTKDPKKLSEIDQGISRLKNELEVRENSSYDNIKSTYGANGVYSTLYQNQYFDNVLSAYSYEPRLIKRELDQVQAENIKFERKILEYDQDYLLKASENDLAWKKFESEEAKDAALAKNWYLPGDLTTIEDYGKEKTNTDILFENRDVSINAVKDIFKSPELLGYNLTNAQLAEVAQKMKPENLAKGNSYKLTIDGKEMTIDLKKHRQAFIDLYNNVTSETPERKQYYDGVNGVVSQTAIDLGSLIQQKNFDYRHIPNFTVRIAEVNGKKQLVQLNPQQGENYYGTLLKKSKGNLSNLTELERQNLEMYTTISLISDDEIDQKQKTGLYNYMMDKTLYGVRTNQKLPNKNQMINGNLGNRYDDPESYRREHGDLTGWNPTSIVTATSARNKVGGWGVTDIGWWDAELPNGRSLGNLEDRIGNRLNTALNGLENNLAITNKEMSQKSIVVLPGTQQHQALAAKIGLPVDSKSQINLQRVISDGKDMNTVTWSYTTGTGKNAKVVSSTEPLAAQDLAKAGIAFESLERTPYDTRFGQYATPVKLGDGNVDMSYKVDLNRRGYMFPVDDGKQQILQAAQQQGPRTYDRVKREIADFQNGKYQFSLEVEDGVYKRFIYKDGVKVAAGEPVLGVDRYTKAEVANMYELAALDNQQQFFVYLDNLVTQIEE